MRTHFHNRVTSVQSFHESQDPGRASMTQRNSPSQQRAVTSLDKDIQFNRTAIDAHQQDTDATGASPKKHKHRAMSLKGIKERFFQRNHRTRDTKEGRNISDGMESIGNTSLSHTQHNRLEKHGLETIAEYSIGESSGTREEILPHEPVSERFTERLKSPQLRSSKVSNEVYIEKDSAEVNAESKPPVSHIAGPDGFFYFVNRQGDLHRFDPTVNEVLNTGLTNVDQVSMGADGSVYARMGEQLITLDRKGMPERTSEGEASIIQLNIPGEVHDFTKPSSKDDLYVLNKSGGLYRHSSDAEAQMKPLATAVSLPIELMTSEPRSIASAADGSMWMMDAGGSVWHGTPDHQATPENNATSPDELQWKKMPESSQRMTRLDTLPDGSVAGKDLDGGVHRFEDHSALWQKVPLEEMNQSLFKRMHGALPKQNKAELITFLGGVGTVRPASSDTIKHPLKSLGNVAKSISTLYQDIKHFDYSKQQQNPVARYDAQVESFWNLLSTENMPAIDRNALVEEGLKEFTESLDAGVGNGIKSATKAVLQQVESDQQDPKLSKEFKKPKGASQNDNVLARLKESREMIYGQQDEISQKLGQMIDKGTFVSMDSPRYRGVMASLVTDHAIMNELAHKAVNKGVSMEEAVSEAKELQNQALPNLVAKSGISDTDPMGNAAKGFDAMQAILRQKNDMLPRIVQKYASAMGWKEDRKPTMAEASTLFGRMAHTMKPGDSVSFGKSTDNGFNTENFRVVISGAFAKLTGGVAVAWVLPILDVGKLKGVGMNISKTDDGIRVEMNRSRGSYVQAGVRTGLGLVGLPQVIPEKSGSTWLFGGWEIAVKGKKTDTVNDSIAFTIKDNGKGNIGRVLGDVMTGQADLFDLMRQSEEVNSAHDTGRNWNLGVGNVLVGAGGTDQPGWDALNGPKIPGTSGKVLGAIVPEVALDFGSKSSASTSTSSTGQKTVSQTKQGFGLQGIRTNLVGVGVLESDYLKVPLPGDMMLGKDVGNPGLTGRMNTPSVLPGVILGKGFDRLSPTSKNVTLTTSSTGEPVNINVNLTISRTSNLLKKIDKDGDLLRQVPGFKQAVDQLLHQQGKKGLNFNRPISIAMELKPEVRARIEQETPQGGKDRLDALKNAAKELNNFRLKGMDVSHSNEAKKGSPLVIPARTRVVGASMGTSTPLASVQMVYDKASVIHHGESIIHDIGSYDDGAWGTSSRQFRLTRLMHQLDNMVDSLGKEPEVWDRGDSLKQNYQSERNLLKDTFTQKVRTLMTDKASPEQINTVVGEFRHLAEDMDKLKDSYNISGFHSPAVITSGPLFDKPDAGKLNNLDEGLQPKDDMLWTKAITLIDELASMDLSSLKAKKSWLSRTKTVDQGKAVAQNKVDEIKRAVNAVADAKPEFKQELFVQIDALAARPTSRSQLANVKRMLVKMNAPE